jgi:hypothetical protein
MRRKFAIAGLVQLGLSEGDAARYGLSLPSRTGEGGYRERPF